MLEPEWSDFRIVLALSRGGSVAGAARLLDVDASTISRRLRAVEESMGACLVVRGGRSFSLTSEGQAVVAAAEAMEKSMRTAAATIRAAKQGVEGVVKFSFVGLLVPVLMPLTTRLNEKYPKLFIDMMADNRIVDLAKGEADVALRMVRPTQPDLVAVKGLNYGWGIYATRKYAETHGLPETYNELSNHHLLYYTENMHVQPAMRWLEDYSKRSGPATRVNSTDMAMHVISTGEYIGVVPCFEASGNERLVRVFPEPFLQTTAYIVYHESHRNTARIRIFVNALLEFFHQKADFFRG